MRTRLILSILLAMASFLQAADPAWKVKLEAAGKVRANYPSPFTVQISDEQGKPVAGADVQVILTMVDMDHGEFKTPAKAAKPGIYEASPTFFMVGKWNVEVRAKKGDKTFTEKTPYEVKE